MKQYRITTANLTPAEDGDCYLSPEDPIHDLIKTSTLGGIGSHDALGRYNSLQRPIIAGSNKGQIAREQNIQPGTEAWFKHWFGDKR